MSPSYQYPQDLQELAELLKAGIPHHLLQAKLVKIALQSDSDSVALKAIEMLRDSSEDEGSIRQMTYEDAQWVRRITTGLVDRDGLDITLENFAGLDDLSQDADAQGIVDVLFARVRRERGSAIIPLRNPQYPHYAGASDGRGGEDQPPGSGDATTPQQD